MARISPQKKATPAVAAPLDEGCPLLSLLDEAQDSDVDDTDVFGDEEAALDDFGEAKAAAEEEARVKDVCYAMRGWGNWALPGKELSQNIKDKFT